MPHSPATRTVIGAVTALVAVLAIACEGDPTTGLEGPVIASTGGRASLVETCSTAPYHVFPGTGEGEIYGSIYYDEVRICTSEESVPITLVPDSPVSAFDSLLTPDSSFTHMWEFWDINASDGPCQTSPRASETAHSALSGLEHHCVTLGRHRFTGPKPGGGTRTFYVDYIGTKAPTGGIVDTSVPGNVAVAAYPGESSVSHPVDLVIQTDLGSTSYGDSAVLHVDATLDPNNDDFVPSTSISVDSSYTFRASAYHTSVDWNGYSTGRYLARLHYKAGAGSWTPLTNFYMPVSEGRVLRKFKLPGPTGCPASPITYTIGLEVMQPNQVPQASPSSDTDAQRTITVTCPAGGSPTLAAPTGIGASSVGQTSATVSWTNGSSSTGVTTTVQTNDNEGGGWVTKASSLTASTTTSTALTSLEAGTVYDVRIWHDSAGVRSDTTVADNLFTSTVPTPTSLGSTSVGSTSATVTWSNSLSTTGTTTEVEYKSTGAYGAATPAAGAGVTSKALSGLSASTTYDVRIRHVRNGQASSWLESLDLFTTSGSPPSITFQATDCDHYYSGGKWRDKHLLSWSGATGSWQIRASTTNDTTSGSVVASGSLGTSWWTDGYIEIYGPEYWYFWVKVSGSAWTALAGNPLETTSCEL